MANSKSEALHEFDGQIDELIRAEEVRQQNGIELIASENYISPAVMAAMGSVLNNRYSEGYPGNRYYGGQAVMDDLEDVARSRALALFGGVHANVQPHAGAPANLAAYFAVASPGDKILGMDLSHGGHLTHGSPVTHASKIFQFVRYGVSDVNTGKIDYDAMLSVALREKPRIILAGQSSFPRSFNYREFRRIADKVGAVLIADIAHTAGLIAAGELENPLDSGFDILLSTTHKTLRGPRGGLIISADAETGRKVDKSVFPGLQGGPIMQMVAAKAVAFKEASSDKFREYARGVLANASKLASELSERGVKLISGGTDNHLMVVDCVSTWGLSGLQVQERLDAIGVTINKNKIPDDKLSARETSGIRIGTPAMTTRGMRTSDVGLLAQIIVDGAATSSEEEQRKLRETVVAFASRFPVPGVSRET